MTGPADRRTACMCIADHGVLPFTLSLFPCVQQIADADSVPERRALWGYRTGAHPAGMSCP